jgi:hypothetical protein
VRRETLVDSGVFNITHPKIPEEINRNVDQIIEYKFLFSRLIIYTTARTRIK